MDSSNRTTILVHFYRAMVGRADVWRTRMDTTTHWAIGATAAVISFVLSNATVPHYVIAIATLMTCSFLYLEARRLTFYHLFQQRVLLLEEGLMRPALSLSAASPSGASIDPDAVGGTSRESVQDLSAALDAHLGRTVPIMPMMKAVARRLRRVYLWLFMVQLLAWSLKVTSHPEPARSFASVVQRADVGFLPGEAVIAILGALLLLALALSFTRGGVDRDPA